MHFKICYHKKEVTKLLTLTSKHQNTAQLSGGLLIMRSSLLWNGIPLEQVNGENGNEPAINQFYILLFAVLARFLNPPPSKLKTSTHPPTPSKLKTFTHPPLEV